MLATCSTIATHSPSAIRTAAHRSQRRRSAANTSTAASAASTASAEFVCAELGVCRTSSLRSHSLAGTYSHHGLSPTARTSACHPTVVPSVCPRCSTVRAIIVKLPGLSSSWLITGAVQQAHTTTTAASAHGQTRRRPVVVAGAVVVATRPSVVVSGGVVGGSGPVPAARRARSRPSASPSTSPPRPTPSTTSVGARYMRWVCSTNELSRAASGSSRYSPQASDQPTNVSARNGNRAAAGFQMSCRASPGSDWHISEMPKAAANMSTNPPRRRASATHRMIASVLSTHIATARLSTLP